MSLTLDHAVIAVRDLDIAIQDYRALGFTVRPGGIHTNRATHNALIVFADSTYLELLAPTGEAPLPGLVDFSVLLQLGEGLAGFALRSADLDADVSRLRSAGFDVGVAIPGERRRSDGTLIRWKLALLGGGFAPFLIQDVTPLNWRVPDDPAVTTHANGAAGLHGVEIAVCAIAASLERYRRLLGEVPPAAAQDQRRVGPLVLREIAGTDCPETLVALHLAFASQEDRDFPLRRTHGVRFERQGAHGGAPLHDLS